MTSPDLSTQRTQRLHILAGEARTFALELARATHVAGLDALCQAHARALAAAPDWEAGLEALAALPAAGVAPAETSFTDAFRAYYTTDRDCIERAARLWDTLAAEVPDLQHRAHAAAVAVARLSQILDVGVELTRQAATAVADTADSLQRRMRERTLLRHLATEIVPTLLVLGCTDVSAAEVERQIAAATRMLQQAIDHASEAPVVASTAIGSVLQTGASAGHLGDLMPPLPRAVAGPIGDWAKVQGARPR
ncbi:MAG: hypothetical protein SPI77_09610 [Corynebacterium sp.]|nr:hypothetical protein [Corynebacterium sp.]